MKTTTMVIKDTIRTINNSKETLIITATTIIMANHSTNKTDSNINQILDKNSTLKNHKMEEFNMFQRQVQFRRKILQDLQANKIQPNKNKLMCFQLLFKETKLKMNSKMIKITKISSIIR